MSVLPIALLALLLGGRKKSEGAPPPFSAERLLEIVKLLSAVKESGLGDFLHGENPLQSILSGNLPIEKLLSLLSVAAPVFTAPKKETDPTEKILSAAGAPLCASLKKMLNELEP